MIFPSKGQNTPLEQTKIPFTKGCFVEIGPVVLERIKLLKVNLTDRRSDERRTTRNQKSLLKLNSDQAREKRSEL